MSRRSIVPVWTIAILAILLSSCHSGGIPKPYGYFRIDLPEHAYRAYEDPQMPFVFDYSSAASVALRDGAGEGYWLDVVYPDLKAKINCTYKPVRHNLRELGDDAQEFVFKHAGMATSIPEQGYENPDERVYGVYYELKGNTASPCQFYVTDSTSHFFRGALYFECVPNQDSLAPVIDYLTEDVRHMVETIRWK